MLAGFVIAPSLAGSRFGGLSCLGLLVVVSPSAGKEAILGNRTAKKETSRGIYTEYGSIHGFDVRSRHSGRGRAILKRRMNLGIVVDREPTLEIKWKESGESLCMKRGKDKVNREQYRVGLGSKSPFAVFCVVRLWCTSQ